MATKKKSHNKNNNFGLKYKTKEERVFVFNELIKHLEKGLSTHCFEYLDHESIDTYAKSFPSEFDIEKIEAAKRKGRMGYEMLFTLMASGKIKHGNATALIFLMKNRYGWGDRQELDITTQGQGLQLMLPPSPFMNGDLKKINPPK